MRASTSLPIRLSSAALAAFVASIVGAGSTVAGEANASGLSYLLKPLVIEGICEQCPILVGDVDRDGNDDLLVSENERLLWYRFRDRKLILAGTGVYESPGRTVMAADADGDGYLEFFVLTKGEGWWDLARHDWFSPDSLSAPTYTIRRFYPARDWASVPWRRINFFGTFPPVRGDHPTILFGINPISNEGSCRSLLAYDGVTGEEIWRFDFGPISVNLACDDFGSDAPRVVFTTQASGRRVSANGTTGGECYVFCLDLRDGRLLWRKLVGGDGASCQLALVDFDADGRNEICLTRNIMPDDSVLASEPHRWNVAVLNGAGDIIRSIWLAKRPRSVAIMNLDRDPRPEFIVDGIKGTLVFLDHDLTIRNELLLSRDMNTLSDLRGLLDLNGDGRKEIVYWLNGALLARDRKGTVIAEYSFHGDPAIRGMRCDGRDYLATLRSDTLRVLALERPPIAARLRANAQRLTLWAALALVGLAALSQFRRLRRWRRERGISFDAEQNELLTAMSAYYHGGASLKIMDRIRFNLKNWDRIRSDETRREGLLAELHRTFMGTVVPELRRLVILARRARVPEDIWRTLLSDAEIAGKEIEATAGGSGDTARQGRHVARALQALDDADESIARIRAHLRSVFRVHLGEALGRIVDRFREEHAARGVSFAFAPDARAADVHVFISPVSLDKIIESLLSNAVRATEGRSGAEIAVLTQEEGDYLRIDIRDNGCGIPRDDWDRVFDRAYTTKAEGGGFGLHYAREEVAKFQGKLYVLDSREGEGTTMRVILRKSGKAGTA